MARSLTLFSPAKVNLFLAITERRTDGFHDLLSVVAPVSSGDELTVNLGAGPSDTLICDDPDVPVDGTNLVLRAAAAYRAACPGPLPPLAFALRKRTPMGAGLGGGSSNAVAALRACQQLSARPLTDEAVLSLAQSLGSDCALFVHQTPLVMRGRGEQIASLPAAAAAALAGRRLLLFKPAFGISTVWAYRQMAAEAPAHYLAPAQAEARLAHWLADPRDLSRLLFNNMEGVAFAKHLALPTLLERLRGEFGVLCGMSGSGSACLALLNEETPVDRLVGVIRDAWGSTAWVAEARIT